MGKYVITTVTLVERKYYVDVNDPTWAMDSIVCNELDDFCQRHHSEDIISCVPVDDYPKPQDDNTGVEYTVNGATYTYNKETEDWDHNVRWDLAP